SENGAAVDATSGVSDSSLEMKWRFYEREGFSLALKPGLSLPTGDESRGLGTGRASWSIALIGTYDAEPWTVSGNLAYARLRFSLPQDEAATRSDLWRVSGSAVYALSGRLKLV